MVHGCSGGERGEGVIKIRVKEAGGSRIGVLRRVVTEKRSGDAEKE